MKMPSLQRLLEFSLLGLIVLTFLFRGGKGIEATWLLAGIGCLLILATHWTKRSSNSREDVPLWFWMAGMLFVLWTILAYVFSLTQNYGFDEMLRDSTLMLLLFWMMRRSKTAGESQFLKRLVSILVFLTILGCTLA